MEENVNLDDIFENSAFTYSKLFELYCEYKEGRKDESFIKKCINEVCYYYISKEPILTKEQKVFLSKIILEFSENIIGYPLNIGGKDFKKEYQNNLHNKEIGYRFRELENKNENEIKLEDIILSLIKYFLKYTVAVTGKKDDKINTPEEEWNEICLHLENFEITETIRNGIIKFLNNNKKIENFFNEIKIRNLMSTDSSQILNKIYEYIKFKSIKKRKKLKLKEGADKERKNDDYGRKQILKDKNFIKTERSKHLSKADLKNIKKYLKHFVIKIDVENILGTNDTYYYYMQGDKTIDIEDSFEEILDNDDNNNYINDNDVKTYKKYLEFINKVKDYVKSLKDKIILKEEIYLELEPINDRQREEVLHEESHRRDLIKDIPEVRCKSYFCYKEDKNDNKKQYQYYRDDNVLVYGIYGKLQGIIFMMNELCNEDYKDKEQ